MKRSVDWTLLFCAIILSMIGVLLIYSASPDSNLWLKQLIYVVVGIVLMIVIARIPMRVHYSLGWIYYGLILVVLTVALFQSGEIKRWIHLGPLGFQPSEFAKLAVVLVISRYLTDRKRDIEHHKTVLISILIIAIPFAIVMGQPDLGTAVVFIVILGACLYAAGLNELYLFLFMTPLLSLVSNVHWLLWAIFFIFLLFVLWKSRIGLWMFLMVTIGNLIVGITTPAIWNNLHEYQKERILVFLDPSRDPFGAGYQIIQSKIAVGSGQFWGKGFLAGTQTRLAFLPAKHTDFIFAVLAEQFGFIGSFIVLAIFLLMFYRILKIADESRNIYNRLVAIGIGATLFFGAFVNIGMVTGIMPVTGLPLPFLSSGGSSLIASFAMIGILLNIYSHRVEGP